MDRAESHRVVDGNGFFEIRSNPLSKVGVFPYSGAMLDGAPDPSRVYQVYRPAEELADPACLDSFRLLPIVNDHTMLGDGEGLTPTEQKGAHGVIGDAVTFSAPYMLGNLKIFSKSLADAIGKGKRELSLGYRCAYDWTPGEFNGQRYDAVQRGIRGNHLALVAQGRMGPDVAVLDHRLTIDSLEQFTMADNDNGTPGEGELTLAQAEAMLEKLVPFLDKLQALKGNATAETPVDAAPAKTDAELAAEKAIEDAKAIDTAGRLAGMDSALKAATATIAKLTADAALAPAVAIKAAVQDAAEAGTLAKRIAAHAGTFDTAGMTRADVVAYGVSKFDLKPEAGSESVALDAYLIGRGAAPVPAVSHTADSAPSNGTLAARFLNPKE